jgi:1,2-phenylacetyl-CoA epoxidase catalytic subunit
MILHSRKALHAASDRGSGAGRVPTGDSELHDRDQGSFLEEVHSFEFWFQAVEGYLTGTSYGHHPETTEETLDPDRRERLINVLANYCMGETAALEGAAGLIEIAPNRMSKVFLATQVADEGRHLEVFLKRMADLGVADPEKEVEKRASPSLRLLHHHLLTLIDEKDWDAAVFTQNVALESLEFVVFRRHLKDADAVTAEVLDGVIKDERRHMGFGENEIGRRLLENAGRRTRLAETRRVVDHLILELLADTADHIGIPPSEREGLGRQYLETVARLGLAP